MCFENQFWYALYNVGYKYMFHKGLFLIPTVQLLIISCWNNCNHFLIWSQAIGLKNKFKLRVGLKIALHWIFALNFKWFGPVMGFTGAAGHKEALSNLASPFDLAQTKPAARRLAFSICLPRAGNLQKNGASVCYYLIAFVLKAHAAGEERNSYKKRREEGIGADFFYKWDFGG